MTDKNNSPTYQAQRLLNDPTAWRGLKNEYITSSSLGGISLKELEKANTAKIADFAFQIADSRNFFDGVKAGFQGILDLLNQDSVEADIVDFETALFNFKAPFNLYAKALKSARTSLELETYQNAVETVEDAGRAFDIATQISQRNLKQQIDIVNSQVDNIQALNGAAGRKAANNVVNSFIAQNEITASSSVDAAKSLVANLISTGSIGSQIIAQSPALMLGPTQVLETAYNQLCADVEGPQESITSKLGPLFSGINDITRFLPSNIKDEVQDIVNQVTGVTDLFDAGLSAIKSDGSQLQPLAGRFGNDSGVRVSTQRFDIPSDVAVSEAAYGTPGDFGNGILSTLSTIFSQSVIDHPRLFTPDKALSVSGPARQIATDLLDPRLAIVDVYRKYPPLSVLSPEVANGPSLTSSIVEPVINTLIGNSRSGTTVAELDDVFQTAEQIVVPRLD